MSRLYAGRVKRRRARMRDVEMDYNPLDRHAISLSIQTEDVMDSLPNNSRFGGTADACPATLCRPAKLERKAW